MWGHIPGLKTGLGTVHRNSTKEIKATEIQLKSTVVYSCETYLFVSVRADLWVAGGKHSLRVTQHGAPVLGVLLCYRNTSNNLSRSEELDLVKVYQNESNLPLSRLRLQGLSKLLLTSGQLACVFQLLAKPTAVASGTPLSLRKSSAWLPLKFPHRPACR